MTDAWWLPTVAPTEWDESSTGAGRALPSAEVNLGGGHTIEYVDKNELRRVIAQSDLFGQGQIESIGKHVAAYLDVIAAPPKAKADAGDDEVAGVRAAKAASKARHPANGAPAEESAEESAKKAAPRRAPRTG